MIDSDLKDNNNKYQLENNLNKKYSPFKINQNTDNSPDSEKNLINSLKLEMARLKDNLAESQSKINELFQENNKLKILQLENAKKLSVKEDIINSNKIEINRIQTKNNSLESDNNSKKNLIQDLNYRIIELTQKIESLESINKINQKIKTNDSKNNEKDYLLEINELHNKINEIEIKNSKLNFDNKNLENKIKMQNNEKKNEIDIIELLHKKKIENLEKNILNLNNTINEMINENKKQPKEFNYAKLQNDIYKNISELEEKIRKYDNDNFNLKKENQKLKNENEELKIIINGKDNIINKLQLNINKIENDFKMKLSELNLTIKAQNNNNKMNEINNNDINNNVNNNFNNNMNNNNMNNENMENLINEQKRLIEENEILKNNYEQMTLGINEANELFLNKQKEYENIINYQNEKLKEYKYKISLLKIKINELHSEVDALQKNNQIRNVNNFYPNNNDNLLSTIERDQNSIDLNFTPEQIKLINTYNSPINNPRNNVNYKINNLNVNNK